MIESTKLIYHLKDKTKARFKQQRKCRVLIKKIKKKLILALFKIINMEVKDQWTYLKPVTLISRVATRD